ncbi:transcriptional regulator [Desulfovibrio ferrophilus]|uniref:TRASH domain-containing protein n=1 Tax=Desulfovibrio ferrophilus TaxID=241368 RepID=A0A2Z6AWW4_9BACT|nr:transcriptional regulator [Desulfovibrio ferrophilus]BBD07688.1 TRASH domain-containing protein [Desulfovibrio ferrophilus]
MLKFIVIGVALFFLYKMFKGDARKKETHSDKERDRLIASGEMIKDPICGTYVDKDADIRVKDDQGVHCFCSFECRDKYLKQLESGE